MRFSVTFLRCIHGIACHDRSQVTSFVHFACASGSRSFRGLRIAIHQERGGSGRIRIGVPTGELPDDVARCLDGDAFRAHVESYYRDCLRWAQRVFGELCAVHPSGNVIPVRKTVEME